MLNENVINIKKKKRKMDFKIKHKFTKKKITNKYNFLIVFFASYILTSIIEFSKFFERETFSKDSSMLKSSKLVWHSFVNHRMSPLWKSIHHRCTKKNYSY